ncbi:putative gamma-glutamyltransferase ywrD [Coleophoma cylindrospora]|uniref:Putative gamma-glutamyltransferase ywrD n=1 Tax=Coleophoma cylindrospora TaxID=1849047 RepID=A0A3D8QGW2_9HELO|nr:putative gamma-glutamyltransferase ywrD [Coleophoma cylindrospora]
MPLNANSVFAAEDPEFSSFPSRRSVVHSTEGIVACTQPLAARCGQKILDLGGNAADAAVAVAAGLNMTEPMSTGIGGDMFCLFYDAEKKNVSAMNGSGRAGSKCTLENIRKDLGFAGEERGEIPLKSAHSVTVPGAAAGWVDTVKRFGSGKLTMEQILAPAIELGERGFPVSELSSTMWRRGEQGLKDASPNFAEMLKKDPKAPNGCRGPKPGEIMKNPDLANTFRTLAKEGVEGFYKGRIADAIVDVVKSRGGFLEKEDLMHHMETGSEPVDPISYVFKGQGYDKTKGLYVDGSSGQGDNEDNHGVEVWEHPPNGQGIVALMALGIIEALEETGKIPQFKKSEHNSAPYLHALIEALRIAFADASWWVSDPSYSKIPMKELVSKKYLSERAKLFDPTKASDKVFDHGSPAHNHSDTVYFAVTDKWGNGISFINSNFHGFGSSIIPKGCGFTLQNRGANFSLVKDHPNVIAPRKRPYHTIIPAMVTNAHDGSLHSVYGVMGGFMQPQGHVQVLLNMIAFKYNPQAALDAPRFCIGAEGIPGDKHTRVVYLEEGISSEVAKQLSDMGHLTEIIKGYGRGVFGRGQIIRSHIEDDQVVFSGGSDQRGDGAAFPG